MKKCSKCGVEKELSEFHKDKIRKDGLHSYCKTCQKTRTKKWYVNNKERAKESAKEWRINNREYNKEWYVNNKERAKELNKLWYENNKEHVYNLNRTTEGKYTQLKGSAKKRGIEMQISLEQYVEIIKENKCYYCDTTLAGTTGSSLNRVDNNKGYLVENVKPCCGTCNSIMNNYSIEELSNRVYKIVARMKKLQKENK